MKKMNPQEKLNVQTRLGLTYGLYFVALVVLMLCLGLMACSGGRIDKPGTDRALWVAAKFVETAIDGERDVYAQSEGDTNWSLGRVDRYTERVLSTDEALRRLGDLTDVRVVWHDELCWSEQIGDYRTCYVDAHGVEHAGALEGETIHVADRGPISQSALAHEVYHLARSRLRWLVDREHRDTEWWLDVAAANQAIERSEP